jgi:hypothetical protein
MAWAPTIKPHEPAECLPRSVCAVHPWDFVPEKQAQLPDRVTSTWVAEQFSRQQPRFERLLRAHLVPADQNDLIYMRRWRMFWRSVAFLDQQMRSRVLEVLQGWHDLADEMVSSSDLDDQQRRTVEGFASDVADAIARVHREDHEPMAWAGNELVSYPHPAGTLPSASWDRRRARLVAVLSELREYLRRALRSLVVLCVRAAMVGRAVGAWARGVVAHYWPSIRTAAHAVRRHLVTLWAGAATLGRRVGAWARGVVTHYWPSIRTAAHEVRQRISHRSLWTAVLLAVGVVIVFVVAVNWAIGARVGFSSAEPARRIEVYLAALAGVAGAVALVAAYRKRRDTAQGGFTVRFGAAAAQLGDHDAAVRMAGVYAMAGVADESRSFARRQQCIDVLCGYLRLPYDPAHGSSHRTGQTRTTTDPDKSNATVVEQFTFRQNEREVRDTIVRLITTHLQPEAKTSWSQHSFDFTHSTFEDARFTRAVFAGPRTTFTGAAFLGTVADFSKTLLSGADVSFASATFNCTTTFDKAKFTAAHTRFDGTTFGSTAVFMNTCFDGLQTWFARARFIGDVTNFEGAVLPGSSSSLFHEVEWRKDPNMDGVTWRPAAA